MIRLRDTSNEAARRQFDAIRAMTSGERLEMAVAMSAEVRQITTAGIRDRHPSFTDAEVAVALARLVLGADLADRVARSRRATTQ
ncbi:MAG: hypothetical protein ABI553_00135 [Chloroflexota bacterium]